jgi:hypothetical protein
VPRLRDGFLDVHASVSERGERLPARGGERGVELARVGDETHALASAARRRFQHDRVAELLRRFLRLLLASFRDRLLQPRHDRNAGLARLPPRAGLLAHLLHRLGWRPDEDDACVAAGAGESRVLAEEAIPRVDGVGGGRAGGREHVLDGQVALPRGRGTDADRLVAGTDVQRGAIGVAVHRDAADSHLAASTRHPDGDLAAIRDEDLADGHARIPPEGRETYRAGGAAASLRRTACSRVRADRRESVARAHRARDAPPPLRRSLAVLHHCPATPTRGPQGDGGEAMEFDAQDHSWKARHDRHAPTRGAGRLILALAVLVAFAVAAQVESSPSRAGRAKVTVTAAATPDAP